MIEINGVKKAIQKAVDSPKINLLDPITLAKGGVIPLQVILAEAFGLSNVRVNDYDEVGERSALGLPVRGSLTFEQTQYKTDRKRQANELYVPCVIIEANAPNIIEKTQVQASKRRGTVKEFICEGDIQVNIKGLLCNDTARRPEELVRRLQEFKTINKAIGIQNALLTDIGVYAVTIDELRWVATPGKVNVQAFEINASSDLDVEFDYYENLKLNGSVL